MQLASRAEEKQATFHAVTISEIRLQVIRTQLCFNACVPNVFQASLLNLYKFCNELLMGQFMRFISVNN